PAHVDCVIHYVDILYFYFFFSWSPAHRHLHLSLHDALPIFAVLKTESGEISFADDAEGDLCGHGTACAGIVRSLAPKAGIFSVRSEEHTSELQSLAYLVCRLLLEKKKDYSACSMSNTYRNFA